MQRPHLILIFGILIIVAIIFAVYSYEKRKKIMNGSSERILVTCVPNCAEDEICIKGACVKKKINYTS